MATMKRMQEWGRWPDGKEAGNRRLLRHLKKIIYVLFSQAVKTPGAELCKRMDYGTEGSSQSDLNSLIHLLAVANDAMKK